MNPFEKISQLKSTKRQIVSISIAIFLAGILTVIGIYGVGEYGIAIFIITPFFLGFAPVILFGYKNKIRASDSRKMGFYSLTCFMLGLVFFAIEGLICIIMALPIGLIFAWIGSYIGYLVIRKSHKNGPVGMFILVIFIPSYSLFENQIEPKIYSVETSIEIAASPQKVWENVVEFPQLEKPKEFIFQTGISYPINATIKGKGIGAVRYCNFTTGSFVEPITKWDEPNLLSFNVIQQPAPMKEISFWDIDAPHLQDYFSSKKGQFKLIRLSNGNTKLIGTTWYSNNIKPNFYWNIWSDYIVHQIHNRVLKHIKKNAEI